jgi:hypothetical protein
MKKDFKIITLAEKKKKDNLEFIEWVIAIAVALFATFILWGIVRLSTLPKTPQKQTQEVVVVQTGFGTKDSVQMQEDKLRFGK